MGGMLPGSNLHEEEKKQEVMDFEPPEYAPSDSDSDEVVEPTPEEEKEVQKEFPD